MESDAALGATQVLRFLGGAGTVTGSRFLLDAGGSRVLVDCGLFQGEKQLRLRNWTPFPVDPSTIDAVVVTHAHLDHVGYLPRLARDGFHGPVYCSPNTAALATIVLDDSARLHEEEADYANRKGYSKHRPALPLYTVADAECVEAQLTPIDFDTSALVAPGIRVLLRPAGHILGSATVQLELEHLERMLLFTGDLGRPHHPLLRPPADPVNADVVVTESAYGNRRHEDEAAALNTLATTISSAAERGGTILIPAFAVDRTEVVVLALGRLIAEERIPALPIFVDSPMALAVLDVYREAIARCDTELRPDLGDDPFGGQGDLHTAPTPADSRALNDVIYPSIIISASGMATGGRVVHHLAQRLPDSRNAVVLSGFQAVGTRGRLLADGARSVKVHGRYVPVRAKVVQINAFSVHADEDELVGWLGRIQRAHSMGEAIDMLRARLRGKLEHRAQHRQALRRRAASSLPGEWRHGDLSTERPDYFNRPPDERELIRHKSYVIDWLTPDEAAFDMEQLDFDFYLFRDRASGDDALLERRSEGSYRLTRMRSTTTSDVPSTLTLEHAEHAAPTLDLDEAIELIGVDGERFVFFANPTAGRGNVLYHRYDGHYGLIAPD